MDVNTRATAANTSRALLKLSFRMRDSFTSKGKDHSRRRDPIRLFVVSKSTLRPGGPQIRTHDASKSTRRDQPGYEEKPDGRSCLAILCCRLRGINEEGNALTQEHGDCQSPNAAHGPKCKEN